MRSILFSLALLGLASPVSAGVYNLSYNSEPTPNIPPERVRAEVLQLRAAPVPPAGRLDPGSPRAVYLQQAAALERARADGILSTVGRASLGACYIRLGRARDAIRVLSEGDKDHFLIQANLASAYDQQGDLEVAVRHQERLLDLWPDVWATWNRSQREGYRECEKAYLRLLRSRIAEKRRPAAGPVDIDPIFPGLRLIGPGEKGEYVAGELAPAVYDRTPANAYFVTLQLALWYPQDLRLYWLVGELLNAHGRVIEAEKIIDELVQNGRGGDFKDLMKHRKVLEAAAKVQAKMLLPVNQTLLFSVFAAMPRGTLPPIGVGAIAQQVGAAAPMELARRIAPGPPVAPADTPDVSPSGTARDLPFNWRHVTVGFAFGFLVAALVGFQWQEWRKRRGTPTMEQAEVPSGTAPRLPPRQVPETSVKPEGTSSVHPAGGGTP